MSGRTPMRMSMVSYGSFLGFVPFIALLRALCAVHENSTGGGFSRCHFRGRFDSVWPDF